MDERRLLRALPVLAALAVLGVAGCGSDQSSGTSASASITAPTSVSTTAAGISTTSTASTGLVDGLPRDYAENLGTRPIVVLFYVPGGLDDEVVLKNITELRNSFRDYTFLLYDYSIPEVYGDLAMDLTVFYQPGLVLIDRYGVVRKVWTGFVDKATLNQLLVNLGRE
jgi:hypothetical protein